MPKACRNVSAIGEKRNSCAGPGAAGHSQRVLLHSLPFPMLLSGGNKSPSKISEQLKLLGRQAWIIFQERRLTASQVSNASVERCGNAWSSLPSNGQLELAAPAFHRCHRGFPSAQMAPDSGLVHCAPSLHLYFTLRIIRQERRAGVLLEPSALMESAQRLLLLQQHASLTAVLAAWEYHGPALHFTVWSLLCSLLRLLYKLQNTRSCYASARASDRRLRTEAVLHTSSLDMSSAWIPLCDRFSTRGPDPSRIPYV